ncbi:MAG: hypothetical protein IKS18_06200 [Lachnospiraceae bacterium]|nr:hypothetical protein [Lachnospiraceae bacterium]
MNLPESMMAHFDYLDWILHFEENDRRRLEMDFSLEAELSKRERRLIFPSIRAFQKGEGSDGRYLMETVEDFAEESGESDYPQAMRWFIMEENYHSSYLKQVMNYYGVPGARRNLLDRIFRRIRKGGGIRREVTVLVTAEIIALSYYQALSACSSSPALHRVCDQMLLDEEPHVVFQSYTLGHFPVSRIQSVKRKFLMNGSCFAVYLRYGRLFRKGGYPLKRLLRESREILRQSEEIAAGISAELVGKEKAGAQV